MLVLTRKTDETIMIGAGITVTVLEVRGDHVKIGITAPRSVAVNRGEVVGVVAGENLSAAASSATPNDLLALLRTAGTAAADRDGRSPGRMPAGKPSEQPSKD